MRPRFFLRAEGRGADGLESCKIHVASQVHRFCAC